MKHATTRSATALTLLLALSGCGFTQPSASPSTATASPKGVAAPTVVPAPAGLTIPGGKAKWLSILPDPNATAWDDSTAVARDYTIAVHTWDATRDLTDAYAGQRAALWGTRQLQEEQAAYDADQAKGQAYFNQEAIHRSWTSTAITSTGRDGVPSTSDRDAITVNWTMTPHRRDNTRAQALSGTDDVLLYRTAEGRRQVQGSSTRQDVQ